MHICRGLDKKLCYNSKNSGIGYIKIPFKFSAIPISLLYACYHSNGCHAFIYKMYLCIDIDRDVKILNFPILTYLENIKKQFQNL